MEFCLTTENKTQTGTQTNVFPQLLTKTDNFFIENQQEFKLISLKLQYEYYSNLGQCLNKPVDHHSAWSDVNLN